MKILLFSILLGFAATSSEGFPNVDQDYVYGVGDDSYIVGGEDVKLGELPYQASFQNRGSHTCGGSIIDKQWVMTAAHCVPRNGNPTGRTVVVGTIVQSDRGKGEQIVEVERIVIHPNYTMRGNPFFIINDVALLKLKKSIEFGPNAQPIKLPEPSHRAQGQALVSGWGRTKKEPRTKILQKVTLNLISDEQCRKDFNRSGIIIPDSHLCGGDREGKKSSCHGDSGGPWVDTERKIQIGIVSWGPPSCNAKDQSSVSMEVAYFVPWIRSVIQGSSQDDDVDLIR